MESKNLMQRMLGVMEDVSYLNKDDRVDTGTGKGYKAITEEKVTSVVRQALIKHGIVFYPTEQVTSVTSETVHTKNGDRINRFTHVDVVYNMVNADNPSDFIRIASAGSGVDTQDKGVGKAMTYAYKYALIRALAIATGEDPDKVASDIYTNDLYGDGEETPKSTMKAKTVRDVLIDMAGGDVSRVKKFAEALYASKGMDLKFEDMTSDQLNAVKVQLARKLGQSND